MTKWSDEQILAYLDGVLDLEQGRALYAERRTNRELDAYISAMEVDTDEIARAGDELLADAPQFAFENADHAYRSASTETVQQSDIWRYGAMAAGFAIVFAAGFLTSRLLPADNPPPAKWVQAVAEYQMLYTGQTLALVEKTADQRAREVAMIGRKIDIVLAASDLDVDGLAFKRGQLLTFKNKQLAQFAFVDKSGTPVAFCIIRRAKKQHTPLADRKLVAGMNATVWDDRHYGYVVIGKVPPGTIREYATALHKKMAAL